MRLNSFAHAHAVLTLSRAGIVGGDQHTSLQVICDRAGDVSYSHFLRSLGGPCTETTAQAIDRLRARFGSDAVRAARALQEAGR